MNGISELRSGQETVGKFAYDAAKRDCKVVTTKGNEGGVDVLWVTPEEVKGPEVVLYFFGGG